MDRTGRAGFAVFGFLRQGESGAGRSRKRLPKRKLQLGGSKHGGWVYYDELANVNSYRFRLTFVHDGVNIELSEKTGLVDAKFQGKSVGN